MGAPSLRPYAVNNGSGYTVFMKRLRKTLNLDFIKILRRLREAGGAKALRLLGPWLTGLSILALKLTSI